MKKRIAIIIPAITAVLALLCIVLFFALPSQGAIDEYARQRAAEIWNSVTSKGGQYATKVTIGGQTLNAGGTLNLNTLDSRFTGTVSLSKAGDSVGAGVLTFSSDTSTYGGTYPTIIPNGALKVVLNGGDPRILFDDDTSVNTYAPLLITTKSATTMRSEKIFTQNGDIVIYTGNGTNSTYSDGPESATLSLIFHPDNTGAENGVVGIHSNQKAGLAVKGTGSHGQGYEIILGGTTINAYAHAYAQYGLIDNQSGSITFCQSGSCTVTNQFDKLYSSTNAEHSAVRIAASAKADSCINFKNIGNVTVTVSKGNAVRNHCSTTADFVETSSSYTHNGVNYTRKYNKYSNSKDTIVFDNTGSVTLQNTGDHVFGWGQQLGVLFANNGNIRVRGTGQVTVKETLKTFAIGPAETDAGGCGLAINVNNNENNPHAGLFVEGSAKLTVIALGETSTSNDASMKAEYDALTKTGSYAEQTLQSGRERLAATWVNYGQINVSGTAQYVSYAKRSGTATSQCSAVVIKIGKYVQSGSPNVLFYQENTTNNGIGMEIQSGNTINAALYDANGTEHVLQVPEGGLPDHTETIQNNAGLIVSGGQLEVKSSNWGVRINNYASWYGQDVRISDGIVLIKGNGRTIEGLSTPSATQFQNAYHCNAIGNVDLGSKAYPSNMGSSNAGLAYIGDINEKYTPNTLLSAAGINVTAVMGKTDGKTVIFPANATKDNVYYTSDGAKIMAKQGNTHTASSTMTVQFTPPNMTSYILVRENNGTAYMLGGDDFAAGTDSNAKYYQHTSRNSASGTIRYTPISGGNDLLTINNVSGVQEIVAPTGSLTVTVEGTNTLNNPQDGNIRVTYADGALNLRGSGTLNATAKTNLLYAWGGGITIAGNGTGSSNLKLNLTGDNRLIYNPNGTNAAPITMTDLALTMDVNQAAGYGLVQHGRGDVTLTRCTVNADLYENGESTTLFQIGDHGALNKTDYSSYTPKVTIHDTNITLTSSQLKTAGRSAVLLLQTLGGKLDVTGTSTILSDGRLFYVIGADPVVNFTDSVKITSTGSGADTINVTATKQNGSMHFTVTDSANLLIQNSYSCAIRITGDHPDGSIFTDDGDATKSTINFTVNENAVIDASGRGQVLYLKTAFGAVKGTVGGSSSLTLKNTGLRTVPEGSKPTTDTLYSALRIWATSRTEDGYFTIQDNASVTASCDDKEVISSNIVAAFDLYDFGDSGHKGIFTIKDNARLDVDGSHAFIMYDSVLKFLGGKTTARANETNGSVFYGKGVGTNTISFLSGSEFYGTGSYGIYEENIGDTLEVQKGAKLYLAGTVKAQNNYAAGRTTLTGGSEAEIFYSGCAPSNQDKYIITGTMENDLEVTIYTFGNVGGKNTHVLSWNGNNGNNRCFDSTNGVYKNKTDTTQVYMVAPGQVVFNNINRGISNGSFTNTYNFNSDGTVKQIKFDKSDVTVELIGDSRIWDQASGGSGGTASSPRFTAGDGSQYLIGSYASDAYGHTLTITAGKSEYDKGGGRLSLQGVNYVVCTRDNLTVEGYACLSIETSTGPGGAGNAFHSARAADDSYYLFRGHAQVYVGAINDNWQNTGNRTSGVGMYMAGGTLHLQVLENSAFNLNTSSYGIYLLSDTAFNKNLKGSNVPTNLLLEIGGNSTIDVTSAGHSIALQTSCNATTGDTTPDYSTVMNETIRLFGNATLNLQNVGATSHEIVYYNHSSGDNLLDIRDYARLNVNRPDGHTSNTTAIALLQYSASRDDKAQTVTAFNNGAKDNSVYILDGATVTITGTGNATNLNYGIELTNHSLGKNTAIIQGTGEKDKPTVNITTENGVKPAIQGIHLSGGYLNQSPHESNTLNISNAEINICANDFGITLSGGTIEKTYGNTASYVSPNNVTIQDATIALSQYNEARHCAFEVRGTDNVVSISGNTNLTMNHNYLGLYLDANGENGNLLNISDNTTIVAQKNTAAYAKNHNITLNSTGLGDNVMNVMQTENGAPNLTLNDTSMYAIYLKHSNASTAEQNNRLTIDGENTVINVNTASSGTVPTAIYMFKEDKGAGENLLTVNKATLNLSAHMWGIVQYQYDSGNNISAKGYNNVVLQDATVNVNTGMTGINLDTSATGGNNLTIDNSTVTIVNGRTNNDYDIQNENYRRGIRLIDKYAGERNSLTVQNGSLVTIGEIQNDGSVSPTKFYIGVDLDKRGNGINEFKLDDAVVKIDIAIPQNASGEKEDTYAMLLGRESYDITENRLIIHGDPETATETLLDAKSTGNVVAMMASLNASTQNTLLFDGDARVNLVNTHDGTDRSRHSAIFYSATKIDFDILTTGTVYLLGKGSSWSSAAVYDNNKSGTTSDILITGTDVTVENYTQNTGDQPGVAWMLSDYGNQTMTIAENANVTFRGRFGGTGYSARPYGLFISGTAGTGAVTVKDNATVRCEAVSVDNGTHVAKWSTGLHLKNGALTIQDNAKVYAKSIGEGSAAMSAITFEGSNCSVLIQGKGYLEANSVAGPNFTGDFWGTVYHYDNPATNEIENETTAPITLVKDENNNDGIFVVKGDKAPAFSAPASVQVVNSQQAAAMGLLKSFTITKEAETIPATGAMLISIAVVAAMVSVCTLVLILRGNKKKAQ